ncbi:ABC transporter permease [Catellatospora sichuanensis]|uniref:ABC transporter permease n=1 Tax=Catellatospora sichuanensis TaxID=1969805 RepID=UPI001182F0C7|nr:ABC transporter permease [Catellatospora sichuanensis]
MRLFWASARFQALKLRHSLDDLMVLVTLPLFTIAFMAIVTEAGRFDLAPYAVVGTGIMAIWSIALFVSGEIIDSERWNGTLDATVAAPASLATIVLGRIAVVTLISLFGLAESAFAAWAVFGVWVQVHHVGVFLLTLACTFFAMVGTAMIMSGFFVLARSAVQFQNSMSYPFYVLGGVFVPVAVLPGWLQPVSKVVFLSWAADLLRDCLQPAPVTQVLLRLGIILLLGAVAMAIGYVLIRRVLHRVRHQGTVSFT